MQRALRVAPQTYSRWKHLGFIRHNLRHNWKLSPPGVRCLSTTTSPLGTASSNGNGPVQIPQDARVVICGGGIAGVSVAYHLAKRGWSDVLLLDQGR